MILRTDWYYGCEYIDLTPKLLRKALTVELATFEACKAQYLPNWEYRVLAVSTHSADRIEIDLLYDSERNQHIPRHRRVQIDWGRVRIVFRGRELCPEECLWIPDEGEPERLKGIQEVDKGKRPKLRRTLRLVRARTDQDKFRRRLLKIHKKCVITGESTPHALEAAHIQGVAKGGHSLEGNGVVLRADLHRLYDRGVFAFKEDGAVIVDSKVKLSDTYRKLLAEARPSKILRAMCASAFGRKANMTGKRQRMKR